MNKEELMEEFKGNVLRKIQYRESIPEEVNEIVNRSIKNILDLYERYGCSNSTIEEYVDGSIKEVNAIIIRTSDDRKNSQFEQFQGILSRMKREIENKEEINPNKNKEEILDVDFDDNSITIRIMGTIEDVLQDIRNTQSRILESRGYSYERIDQINESVYMYINSIMRNDEKIREYLELDKNELVDQITNEYEEYLEVEEKIDKQEEQKEEQKREELEDKQKDKNESFRDELDAGISLEEQQQFVESFKEEEEKEKQENELLMQELPGDVLR